MPGSFSLAALTSSIVQATACLNCSSALGSTRVERKMAGNLLILTGGKLTLGISFRRRRNSLRFSSVSKGNLFFISPNFILTLPFVLTLIGLYD